MCRVSLLVSHEAYFCVSIAVEPCHNGHMDHLPLNNGVDPLAKLNPDDLAVESAGKTTQVDFLDRIRAAGGNQWDEIDNPAAYLEDLGWS